MKLSSSYGSLALCAVIAILAPEIVAAQAVLVSTPVQGKLGYQPGAYFCEAIVVPAQSTAYLSGQTGGNATDFGAQVKKALDGLNNTLTGLGSSMNAIVKSTVFMTDIDLFSEMNAVYTTYFTPKTLPARSTVEVDFQTTCDRDEGNKVASLVGTTGIEIEFIAVDPIFATMKASS